MCLNVIDASCLSLPCVNLWLPLSCMRTRVYLVEMKSTCGRLSKWEQFFYGFHAIHLEESEDIESVQRYKMLLSQQRLFHD